MSLTRTNLAALLLFLTTLSLSHAETAEPIVVTATRTPHTLDETLGTVTIISREDIERTRSQDIAELLRFHAGMDIGRNGGPGQTTSLFIRGTESNHTLVMIDGVKINPGTIGGAALQNINPDIIERIEIVKGPQSSLYGSDAIGGVINIITRRGRKGLETSASLGTGSDNTYRLNASLHQKADTWRAGVDLSSFDTDGFSTRTTSSIDRGHDNLNVNLYAGANYNGNDIELSHWQASGKTEYLSFFLNPIDQDFTNTTSAISLKSNPSDNWGLKLKLSHISDIIDQNQGNDFSHTRRNVLDWQNDIQLSENQLLTAGLELSRERTKSLSFGTAFNVTTDVNSVYLQDEITFGNHHVILAGRYIDHESFGSHETWNINYGNQITDSSKIIFSAGTGFRAPDSTDRFGFGGTATLQPETSRNIELGLQHKINAQQSVGVSIFHNKIDDLISFYDPDGFGGDPGENRNIQEARIKGIEATYRFQEGPWKAQLEAIYQDPIYNLDPANGNTNVQLARRAEQSLTGSVTYSRKKYNIGLDFLVTDKRKDSDFSTAYNPGYGLFNLSGNVMLHRQWVLQASIENLFDKSYTLANGFNTTERSFFVSLAFKNKP